MSITAAELDLWGHGVIGAKQIAEEIVVVRKMVYFDVNKWKKLKVSLPSGISCMLRPRLMRDGSGCLALHCLGPDAVGSPHMTVIWAASDSILSEVERT